MKNSDVSADVELKFTKRVHFNLEQERELEKHAEGSSRYKRRKKEPKVETEDNEGIQINATKELQAYVKEGNQKGIIEHFNLLKNFGLIVDKAEQRYGKVSSKTQKIKEEVVSSSITGHKLFEIACVKGDIQMIKFLADHLINGDLKRNIKENKYMNFDLFLSTYNARYGLGTCKKEDFIEGLKIFFRIIDSVGGALEHYVQRIAGIYRARDEMREDFITSLHQAEQKGIIAPIDLEELEKIENSFKGKENIAKFSFVETLKAERAKALTTSKPEPSSPSFVQRILEERASNSPAKSPTP